MTKLAPELVRTSDPVIRSPARYRWPTAPAIHIHSSICTVDVRNKFYSILFYSIQNQKYIFVTVTGAEQQHLSSFITP